MQKSVFGHFLPRSPLSVLLFQEVLFLFSIRVASISHTQSVGAAIFALFLLDISDARLLFGPLFSGGSFFLYKVLFANDFDSRADAFVLLFFPLRTHDFFLLPGFSFPARPPFPRK